jgi:hypothetical protein
MTILDDLNERIPDSVRWAFIAIVFAAMALLLVGLIIHG